MEKILNYLTGIAAAATILLALLAGLDKINKNIVLTCCIITALLYLFSRSANDHSIYENIKQRKLEKKEKENAKKSSSNRR